MTTRPPGWILVVAAVLAGLSGTAAAQEDISGTWAGQLEVAPDTQLEIHFVLTRAGDGSYAAVVTSPDPGGIKDVAANAVSFADGRLSMTFDALSGGYEGTLANGELTGEWRQPGASLPLALVPYEAPVLSQADIELLEGQWVGKLSAGGGELTIVFRFETNEDGELVGNLDSPDQGARGIAMSNIELVDGELSFRVARVRGEYTATLEGDRMTGTWNQGQPAPLNMTRGEPTPTVARLGLSAEQMAAVGGKWSGTLTTPRGDVELTIRLETAENGDPVGYLDVPAQGLSDVPISAATYADDGRLTVSILPMRAAFAGDVSGDEATGEWTQGPAAVPLTLTRE
jgi:hypothetical protein